MAYEWVFAMRGAIIMSYVRKLASPKDFYTRDIFRLRYAVERRMFATRKRIVMDMISQGTNA